MSELAMCRTCGAPWRQDCGHAANAGYDEPYPCSPVSLTLWEQEQGLVPAEFEFFGLTRREWLALVLGGVLISCAVSLGWALFFWLGRH